MSRRISTEEFEEQEGWISRLRERWFGEGVEEEEVEMEEPSYRSNRRTGTVLKVHSNRGSQICKRAPRSLNDAQRAAEDLKDRRPVIVNLEKADDDLARRVIDFISGVTYALNGFYERVGDKVFLFTPANIIIADEDEIEPAGKGPFFDAKELG